MDKYTKLWEYIKNNNKESYRLSFKEIENILQFKIDHSFLTYKKNLLNYGYEVKSISMKNNYIDVNKKH